MVCDFAIWTAGGVTVPIYETSSADQVEWILRDSGAVRGVRRFRCPRRHRRVRSRRSERPPAGVGLRLGRPRHPCRVRTRARSIRGRDPAHLRTSASLATIIYTSGTTGRPKGCAITHANLLCQIRNVLAGHNVTELVFNDRSRTLLFIPVAHILARSIQLCAVHNRVHLAHSSDAKQAAALLEDFKPSVVLACPTSSRRSTTRRNTARLGRQGLDLRPGRDHGPRLQRVAGPRRPRRL